MKAPSLPVLLPVLAALLFTVASSSAINITEANSGDYSNSSPGVAFPLGVGPNSFSGNLNTFSDTSDYFRVTVPAGCRLIAVARDASGGLPTGLQMTFNGQSASGTGSSTYTNVPVGPGTYNVSVTTSASAGTNWVMDFNVELADYAVTTSGGQIIVTEMKGAGGSLAVSSPSAGNLLFTATGKTFSVNGGAFLTSSSGNISIAGITTVTVNGGAGADTISVGNTPSSMPDFSIQGGGGDDTAAFTGNIAFAPNCGLAVNLGGVVSNGTVTFSNLQISTSTTGAIDIQCHKRITVSGTTLRTVNGNIRLSNGLMNSPVGSFHGVSIESGSTVEVTGSGGITVSGTGGNGSGGYQFGVGISGGSSVIGGTSAEVNITGYGGNGTGIVNRGVSLDGSGVLVGSQGCPVRLNGTSGALGSGYGIGVSVINGAVLSAGGSGGVFVTGTSIASAGSFNWGMEMGSPGSAITSSGGNILLTATAGAGSSPGIFIANNGSVNTPLAGGNITFHSDSVAIETSVTTANSASSVMFRPLGSFRNFKIGSADDSTSLGLTDAELDRITTANLVFDHPGSGTFQFLESITRAATTDITLNLGPGVTVSTLSAVPDVVFASGGNLKLGGVLRVDLSGTTPNSQYPQFKIEGGGVILNNPFPQFTTSFSPSAGQSFTIIDNDGTDVISGTLQGLPQSATANLGLPSGLVAKINYNGGTGNDVVVTVYNRPTVTNTNDTGTGSLRDAVTNAASIPGPDEIRLDASLSGQTIALDSEISIGSELTIDGSSLAGGLTLDGRNLNRIFSTASTVSLKGLALTRGRRINANGGAIFSTGTLHLQQCTFSGNGVTSVSSGNGGGAIESIGSLTATLCTFADNFAPYAGAISIKRGTLVLERCTLVGNRATDTINGFGGGALDVFEDGGSSTSTLTHCIFSGNSSASGIGPEIWFESGAYATTGNLVGNGKDSGITHGANGNIIGTSAAPIAAKLAALDNYGGLTKTVLVLPGSPAINAANGSTIATDQRGFPVIGVPDIGAVEFQGNNDLTGFWNLDSDGDGVRFGAEFALGMNLAANDPGSANNLKVTKNGSGNPVITLGRNPAANATVTWRVMRSTTLLPGSFAEIFRYVGPSSLGFTTGSSAVVNTNSFEVTDTNPPAGGKAFYRFEVVSP